MTDEIESPCTGLCLLDERQVCKGCFRAIDEIIRWAGADREARLEILRAAARRQAGGSR
jgi:predicted Fe-S protein YdhL (DUF1289 family)